MPVIVQSCLAIQPPARVSILGRVAGRTTNIRPSGVMDREYPVWAVGVPLAGVPGGIQERSDVEVGVTQIVDASVVARAVGVRVLVPQHGGVDVTR